MNPDKGLDPMARSYTSPGEDLEPNDNALHVFNWKLRAYDNVSCNSVSWLCAGKAQISAVEAVKSVPVG